MATVPEDSCSVSEDIRPIVGRPGNDRALWTFAGVLAIAGASLFLALEARREAATNAVVPSVVGSQNEESAPPELVIPQADNGYANEPGFPYRYSQAPAFRLPDSARIVSRPANMAPVVANSRLSQSLPVAAAAPALPIPLAPLTIPPTPAGPALVYQAPPTGLSAAGDGGTKSEEQVTRTHAERLANPAVTVPEGTVIQAVMETALDSSRAGFTRAIVSRDVRGFDGSQVLIPRGSRLYGEYESDVEQGQGRALIRWQRLLRPDGVIMNLDSPATDPLGRAGVKGRVNSHFFARFGGAILQSVLNIGVGLASRPLGSGIFVNLPQGAQGVTVPTVAQTVHPTLSILQGTSVSVYVAHDLDFSGFTP